MKYHPNLKVPLVRSPVMSFLAHHPGVVFGGLIFSLVLILSFGAPLFSYVSPMDMNPDIRLKPPSSEAWLGGDYLGRDLWSRLLHGGRVSLTVGLSAAALTTICGLLIGLLSGYFRLVDMIAMRIMDGLMSIPGILIAIALMTVTGSSVMNVIIAITIPETPRVARLVRSLVLTLREQLYVEAAISSGTSTPRIVFKHMLPNTLAPLAVQATFVCASAIMTEAYLSFLGAGTPPEIASWGNIMAEGRTYFMLAPGIILVPGLFVGAAILSINILGDGLRDIFDPRIVRNI